MSIFERFRRQPPAPEPVPDTVEHPCGVKDCEADQIVVEQDERDTVVECPDHGCYTRWDTKPRQPREQTIIRPQDAWRQHGIAGKPGRG